jgi:fatty acid desaturase
VASKAVGKRDRRAVDWRTLGLAAIIYGGWGAATFFHAKLTWPVLLAVGGWLTAWHGSLQHEIIHGHPTRSRRLNTAIGFMPLSLWLPFEAYRDSHLAHHASPHLTDPGHDPEARYLPATAGPLRRALAGVQATLLGRLVLGPFVEIGGFLIDEAQRLGRREPGRARLWLLHGLAVAAILAWLTLVCHMRIDLYLAGFVYPGAALSLLRSFAEHRADPSGRHRVAVVERAPILGLLFLNNNLHAAHHDRPGAAWHQLPAFYRRERERLLRANGGLVYEGYGQIVRRFFLRPHDEILHPGTETAS